MKKEIVFTDKVCPPKGPYAQAIKISDYKSIIYTGTLTALDKDWNVVGAGDIIKQTEKTIENLHEILIASNATFENVIQTTWYLVNIEHMIEVAKVRDKMFGGAVPASGTIPINKLFFPELLLEMQAVIAI